MALSNDTAYARRNLGNTVKSMPLASAAIIYGGALVGISGGYARNFVKGDIFAGVAISRCDNSAGSAGDKRVEVESNIEILAAVTGVTGEGNVGAPVYASDDNTLTLTAADNTLIGSVAAHDTSTTCWVHINSPAESALA